MSDDWESGENLIANLYGQNIKSVPWQWNKIGRIENKRKHECYINGTGDQDEITENFKTGFTKILDRTWKKNSRIILELKIKLEPVLKLLFKDI